MKSTLLSINRTPPAVNEAEISLFGPGLGECIVLHLGLGEWFIIDTFFSPETRLPIAIEYLESLGLDPSRCVKGVLLTHWHSDHTTGAFELFKRCTSAKLFLPQSFNNTAFLALIELYTNNQLTSDMPAIDEYKKILRYIKSNDLRSRLSWVKAGSLIFDQRNDRNARMVALSPSETTVANAAAKFASLRPDCGEQRTVRIIGGDNENLRAVVAHFTFGEFCALLGSDLETKSSLDVGWAAILECGLYEQFSLQKADVYKVAHHGSSTGEHSGIWSDLLKKQPVSLITPFSKLIDPLPRAADLSRISENSKKVYLTRPSNSARETRRDRMVERQMKAIVKCRKIVDRRTGHIQVRATEQGVSSINLNEFAQAIKG